MMLEWSVAFGATGLAFLLLDGIWLGVTAPTLYRPALASVLAERFNLTAAGALYAIYIVGILILAVQPALRDHSAATATLLGAVVGIVAYGTYALTNLAMMRGWPIKVTLVDLAWGTLVTAAASYAGYWAVMATATAA